MGFSGECWSYAGGGCNLRLESPPSPCPHAPLKDYRKGQSLLTSGAGYSDPSNAKGNCLEVIMTFIVSAFSEKMITT